MWAGLNPSKGDAFAEMKDAPNLNIAGPSIL
jgi:hypothetical protein